MQVGAAGEYISKLLLKQICYQVKRQLDSTNINDLEMQKLLQFCFIFLHLNSEGELILSKYPRLSSKLPPPCLHIQYAGITAVYDHVWLLSEANFCFIYRINFCTILKFTKYFQLCSLRDLCCTCLKYQFHLTSSTPLEYQLHPTFNMKKKM